MARVPLSRCLSALALFGSAPFAAWAGECPAVTLHYNERVPYLRSTPSGAAGLTADPANRTFEKAGVPFRWTKTPSKRQLQILADNTGCDCAVGWFKNPAREKYARFTRPIYQDGPQIAIALADNREVGAGSIEELLSKSGLVLGVKDGYSYGTLLDEKIARLRPNVYRVTGENDAMLKMLSSRRIDYFFIAPEEADGLIAASGLPKTGFRYVTLADMPVGEKRYILCSLRVGEEIINRLNAALAD
jgi:polar amino acid transport system substrate-binding protein